MDIKQYPYITIKENSERDEYGKHKLISIRIDDMSSKYLYVDQFVYTFSGNSEFSNESLSKPQSILFSD